MPLKERRFSVTIVHGWGNGAESLRIGLNLEAQAMIRSELVKKLEAENPGMTGEEVERIADLFFNQIIQRLAEGGRVEIRGFGAFSTRSRNPRKGRNPRTGAAVDVPAKRVPYFKPGKEIRERLNS
jgi:integration host factor subunit beta